jgi:hypothetical protein
MTRTNFVAGVGGTNTPAFYAYKTGDLKVLVMKLNTVVQFNAEYYDTNSKY